MKRFFSVMFTVSGEAMRILIVNRYGKLSEKSLKGANVLFNPGRDDRFVKSVDFNYIVISG